MSWDNAEWAMNHIQKRHTGVTLLEAWEVVFESGNRALISPDQLHFPPYRRYWEVGATAGGKILLVVWEQWRQQKNLITAYEPSFKQRMIYEDQVKKVR